MIDSLSRLVVSLSEMVGTISLKEVSHDFGQYLHRYINAMKIPLGH